MMIQILGAVRLRQSLSAKAMLRLQTADWGVGICNKDAEVICLGCDNDSYCESCWIEGHTDERHRTKRFAAKGGRRAVGA